MPDRYVREGLNTSRRIQEIVAVGGWFAEIFYRRLLNEVDDFALCHTDCDLFRAGLFPLALDLVSVSDISAALQHCADAGLIRFYEVDCVRFMHLTRFRQRRRAKKSKYPLPPWPIDDVNSDTSDECPADVGQMTAINDKRKRQTETINVNGNDPTCIRAGERVKCKRFLTYVLLTDDEYVRLCSDWGQAFADEAIAEYDRKYPNSKAAKNHMDHNRVIRDYVNRGFICQGKVKKPEKLQRTDPFAEWARDCHENSPDISAKCGLCSEETCEYWDKIKKGPILISAPNLFEKIGQTM